MLSSCRHLISRLLAIFRKVVLQFRRLSQKKSRKKTSAMTVSNGASGSAGQTVARSSSIPSWSLEGKVALVTGSSKFVIYSMPHNLYSS